MKRTQLAPDAQRSGASHDGRLAGPSGWHAGSSGGSSPRASTAAGRTVEIRAASAADCEAIRSFVCGLSLRARFLRFFTPAAPPSPAVLRRMCAIGRSADALVATEDGVVIGHAMAVDVIGPDGGRVADVGLVVTDHWQNRGIGSEMLRMVVARAAARGVRGLVMEVLPENRRILAMISRRWAGAGYESGGGSVTIRVRLPDPHGEAGSAATAGLPARADGARGGLGGSRVDTAKGRGHGTAVRAA